MSGHRRAKRRAWVTRAAKLRRERVLHWAFHTSLFSLSMSRRDWKHVRQANKAGKAAIFHKKGATIMFTPPQKTHWLDLSGNERHLTGDASLVSTDFDHCYIEDPKQ